jgi:hypothetical protein
MNDALDVLIAGNLRGDARIEQRQGEAVATAQVCVTETAISAGREVSRSVSLTVELTGPHAYTFARQHRAGSRVVLRGHLDERRATRTEHLPRMDGPGTVAVSVTRHEYILIIDRVLHSGTGDAITCPHAAAPRQSIEDEPLPKRAPNAQILPADERTWSF